MIRSNLSYLFDIENESEVNKKGKVILVTSSAPGEGKSFVTANLAASLGLLDKKAIDNILNQALTHFKLIMFNDTYHRNENHKMLFYSYKRNINF